MTTIETASSEHSQGPRRDRLGLFLAVLGAAHAIAFFGCPSIIVPPRISQQVLTVLLAVGICSLPPSCSLCLLLRGRTLLERVVAFGSLVVSVFWLLLAWDFIQQLLKGP